ncbi:hypothetical protein CVIRNUC_004130 [Coccomyxa viridis]|uniref:Protein DETOXIFICATION n=1 Tax=Coccomyxa viridis TaxID=1274662 RepID=A0AAV1I374_9CHLO|nr:hypothetical protein CVIRNUC_004130 [Coccomyxa viridis]
MSDDLQGPLLDRSGEKDALWKAFETELRAILILCGPACIQLGFQQAVLVTNQIFAGSLGADALAAAAIGFTLFNLCWYFLLGVGSALDTLASQSYGAGDRAGVISWAITAAIVMSIVGVPVAVALFYGGPIAMHVFQQDAAVSGLVQTYTRGMLPGLWPYIWSCVIMKALQAQNLMWAPAAVTVSMFFVNIAFNASLVSTCGFTGAAYAQSASRIAQFLLLTGHVLTFGRACLSFEREVLADEYPEKDPSTGKLIRDAIAEDVSAHKGLRSNGAPETQSPFAENSHGPEAPKEAAPVVPYAQPGLKAILADAVQWDSFRDFLALGLPGGFMMQLEGNSYDITTLLAGLLGTVQVDAHNAMLTLCEFSYVALPFGIATAATIRVGNMLGAGNHKTAKTSAMICIGLCLGFECVTAILILSLRSVIGYLFVNDEDVVHLVSKIAILAAVYQLPDGLYGVTSGVLRGLGMQPTLLWVNLGGFWAIGIVLGVTLTFKARLGVMGLWWGLLSGIVSTAAICTVILARVDWPAEARKAQEALAAAALAGVGGAGAGGAGAADEEAPGGSAGGSRAQHRPGASDPWVGLPRRGAPRPGLLIRSNSSLSSLRSLRSAHTYGSLGSHNTATAMFAPGARH